MSMLIRTGTLVRKNSRKSSVKRKKSLASTNSGSHSRGADEGYRHSESHSVPPSPVAKLHEVYNDHSTNSSPGKASLATTTSTVVSFDGSNHSYKTSVGKHCPREAASHGTSLQIEEVSNEASNVCEFLCTASQIVCSSTFVTSAVGLTLLVPVVMIAFGVKFMDECPLEARIPLYLIVGGCFGILKIAVTLGRSFQFRHQGSIDNLQGAADGDRSAQWRTYRVLDIALTLFLLTWHVLGTVWVLRIWKPRFKPLLHRPDAWCDRSLYFFSVSIVVGIYAVLALLLLGLACLACLYKSKGSRSSRRGNG